MSAHLLTLYTRTPLHTGAGLRADLVDLPLTRERLTQFPVIPSTVLLGVFREAGRQPSGSGGEEKIRRLFGEERTFNRDPGQGDLIAGRAGCVQVSEARLLAFPVRALKGCFAWLTCPAILHRFCRDTRKLAAADIPSLAPDRALVAPKSDLVREEKIFLEEYRLQAEREPAEAHRSVAAALRPLSEDSLWQSRMAARLAIVNDDDFQHFVTTCTEVVQRVALDRSSGRVQPGSSFSQEYLPSETLFYSVLTLPTAQQEEHEADLLSLLQANQILQIGSDESTGHGFCAVRHETLP